MRRQLHEAGELCCYVDCHAHAGRRGCFFYGNELGEGHPQRDDGALFAKLVALNTRWLEYDACTWFDACAHEGSARSAIFGIPCSCARCP